MSENILKLLKKAVELSNPDLKKQLALPRKAKIIKVQACNGRYQCDVKAVLNNGADDEKAPLIPGVEIPSIWSGDGRGLICPPKEGQYCDLNFYNGDFNAPFISNFRPQEGGAPQAELDSFIVQHSEGVRLGFLPDGTVIVEAPKIKAVATEEIIAKAPKIKAIAEDELNLEAPRIKLIGQVEILGSLSAGGGLGATISGPVFIKNGGLTVEKDISGQSNINSQKNIKAEGNILAKGDILAQGSSDNHHGH